MSPRPPSRVPYAPPSTTTGPPCAPTRWPRRIPLRRVDIPTLVIWGDQDRYLGRELAEPDHAWVPEVRVERIPQASHWVQADAPERVNQLMVEFLQPIGG
jgi:pimeloyl-ACP methyl ester carboxylesterase